MCGLLGYFNKSPADSKEYRDWFESMLVVSTLRGWDGTGVAAFPIKGGQTFIYKKPIPGWDFVQSHVWNTIRTNHYDYDMMIGHNRAATHGKAIERHTHPFNEDNIVLTHNGVITNAYKLNNAVVDSQAVAIALNGEDDFVDILEKLDGSFALVWFDYRDQKLRFARNKERPLWLGYDEKKNGILWASEKWALEGIAYRHGLKLSSVVDVSPNLVLEFKYDSEKLEEATTVPFENYSPKLLPARTGNDYSQNTTKTGRTFDYAMPDGMRRGDLILFNISLVNLHKTGKFATIEGDPVDPLHDFIVKCYNVKYDMVENFDFGNDGYKVYCGTVDRAYTTVKNNIIEHNIILDDVKEATQEDIKRVDDQYSLDDKMTEMVIGPDNTLIHVDYFKQLIADGCTMCAMKLRKSDANSISWTADKRPICRSCVKDWKWLEAANKEVAC